MKKPSLGEVAAMGAMDDAPDSEPAMDDDSYTAAVDELAEVIGVSDDKLDAFREAFRAAAMSCK